ncbi:ATP/GTP-binding protein [Nocardiopsis mangrovi]|uniref:ATP/GTP-binding protein n=1 Tax=Nocardiopsis mangrovi TaxID=1179818 RepID=A0ABV9E3A2_9ACTN
MSPRRNSPRRKGDPARPTSDPDALLLRVTGGERRETGPDGEWAVRRISGAAAAKPYRCPGCHQEIPPGMPHVVAWRPFGDGDDRRHWHSSCWEKRAHRGVRPPRY